MHNVLEIPEFIPLPDALRVLSDMGVKKKRSSLYGLVRDGTIPSARFGISHAIRRSDLPGIAASMIAMGDRRKRAHTSSAILANA